MSEQATLEWLSDAVGHATRSANFCTSGCLSAVDPKLEVQGMGPVKLPLKRAKAKALVELCQPAPYGKGTRTLVDKRVRKAFELGPQKFRLSDEWNEVIAGATQLVAEQLGLPVEGLEARIYKLLVYEPGGFFMPHRDSEKHDRMLASMIVALPNKFEGGELVVRHGPVEQRMKLQEAASGMAPCYAAFYADCEHEVSRVSHGIRLALAYNLVLKPARVRRVAAKPATGVDKLAESISTWTATRPRMPLVFALEHQYTERGLSLDLLKGADRQLADAVVSAAAKTDCLIHLAHVSRHLSQFADDGSFERSSWRRGGGRPRKLEIGETYEDDLNATQWTSLGGKKQPWREMPLDVSAVVASTAIEDWKPTTRSTKATRAMPATRSTAGITARRSSFGAAKTTLRSSRIAAPARVFRSSVDGGQAGQDAQEAAGSPARLRSFGACDCRPLAANGELRLCGGPEENARAKVLRQAARA